LPLGQSNQPVRYLRIFITALWLVAIAGSTDAENAAGIDNSRSATRILASLRLQDGFTTFTQRGIHAAKFGSPLVKRRAAHAMLSAPLRDRQTALSLFQEGQYLTIGKP
jgi:hypothetical protein